MTQGVVRLPGWRAFEACLPTLTVRHPLFPLRRSVPRCGGAPWGSYWSRSQAQGPRYVNSRLGTRGENRHPLAGPYSRQSGSGDGPWDQCPVGGHPLCPSPSASGRGRQNISQKSQVDMRAA